jgi:amino-acid N-acetyltransferase
MIRIRKAVEGDLAGILGLLEAAGLPGEGVREHLSCFLVAEAGGRLAAVAGLQPGDRCALLRSVAVDPGARGTGLGIEIVRQALRLALVTGAETVYLLTDTAAGFFPKFGFTPALRTELDALFPDAPGAAPGGRCASAQAMVLRDLSRVLDPHPRA